MCLDCSLPSCCADVLNIEIYYAENGEKAYEVLAPRIKGFWRIAKGTEPVNKVSEWFSSISGGTMIAGPRSIRNCNAKGHIKIPAGSKNFAEGVLSWDQKTPHCFSQTSKRHGSCVNISSLNRTVADTSPTIDNFGPRGADRMHDRIDLIEANESNPTTKADGNESSHFKVVYRYPANEGGVIVWKNPRFSITFVLELSNPPIAQRRTSQEVGGGQSVFGEQAGRGPNGMGNLMS